MYTYVHTKNMSHIMEIKPDMKSFCPPVGLSSADYQQQGKASCVSVNWTLGDAQLEVVNTATGRRRESGTPSRLCKHALFARWNRLYRKVRAKFGQKNVFS